MSGSLFERLTIGVEKAANMETDESIRQHVSRLLTIRQGAVQTLPDYGLPDLNNLNYSRSDLIAECCKAIFFCLDNYEPRLTKIKIEPLSGNYGDFTLAFSLSAIKVDENGITSPWQWSINMAGNGLKK